MDHLDHGQHVLHWSFWQHAMAEVENVARPPLGLLQDALHPFRETIPWTEQQCRIEVALNGDIVPNSPPGVIQLHAPINADYVPPGFAHQLQQRCRPGPEVNHRNTQGAGLFQQRAGSRENIAAVIIRGEATHPTIEDLQGRGSGIHLTPQKFGQDFDELIH